MKCKHCGSAETTHGESCCWCWVFEDGKPAHEEHPECVLAARRLGPIRARFRTAIEQTRENCIQVLQELKHPVESMPRHIKIAARRDPEAVLRAILEMVVMNATAVLRERVKA